MIITCKKQIPKRWIALSILPWAAMTFNQGVMGTALIFSFKKFIDNPAGLTLILSLPWIISMVNGPICSFLSDRVWTRFGRRKPFIVTSGLGTIPCLLLMPLMPSLWGLIGVYMVFGFFGDFGAPLEPLKQEIIPPKQRGAATAAMLWCSNIANITFYFVALGRFDDVTFMAGFPLSGETAIYWTSSLMGIIVLLLIAFGIKEVNQHSALRGERFSIRNFLRGITSSEIWPVYILIAGSAMIGSGLGPLGNLLYTDQWGYSKQDMGVNIAIGGVINIFLIAGLGFIANRLNRVRAYQVLLYIILCLYVAFYAYIKLVLADHRPSLVEMVLFGELTTVALILANVIYVPLVYDFIKRNQMGTYGAGSGIVNRLMSVLTVNGLGMFVWVYAVLFLAPAGDRTRVYLRDAVEKNNISTILHAASWTFPQNGAPAAPSDLWAGTWNALGTTPKASHCWEVRIHNKDSELLAAKKEKLENEHSLEIGKWQLLDNKAESLKKKGKTDAAASVVKEAGVKKTQIDQIAAQIKEIDAKLLARSEDFEKQVMHVLGNRVIPDGEQVIDAKLRDSLMIELPVARRPDGPRLEKILNDLRRECPDVVDLRPVKKGSGYILNVSTLLEPGADDRSVERKVQASVVRIAERRDNGLFAPDNVEPADSHQQAMELKLLVVEEPLNVHTSPVTHVVNAVLGWFDDAPGADDRVTATARSLRLAGETEHVRVNAGANGARTISVIALLAPEASAAKSMDDPVGRRIESLLPTGTDTGVEKKARALYDRIVTAGAVQKLTVAQPFISAAYAPIQYDYTSGYIWMFLLSIIGIAITHFFIRQMKNGKIRRLGLEEAEGSSDETSRAISSAVAPSGPQLTRVDQELFSPGFYVPGNAPIKFFMILAGLAIFSFGVSQMWTPLRLLATGMPAMAEATRIIKTKAGTPDVVLYDDVQVKKSREKKDITYRFWNEFSYRIKGDREIILHCPVASQLKPLYPLLSGDGLPTTLPIRYDAKHPETVVFPTVLSTWFAPGILVVLGIGCTIIGAFLFYWAKKPIELPIISSAVQPSLDRSKSWKLPGAS